MRIALLSDIHGNPFALDAVLHRLESDPVDRIVCLGDVALFGPRPRAALRRVQALGCPVVMGNTDAWALNPTPHPYRNGDTEKITAIELWGAEQLTDADRGIIRSFQPTYTVELGVDTALLCYHGSPRSYNDPIRATTPNNELDAYLAETDAIILAGGHTHVAMVRRFCDRLIINPGSVGRPIEFSTDGAIVRNPPWAEYAILTWDGENVGVELDRVGYDVRPLVESALTSGMPHAEWWVKDWSWLVNRNTGICHSERVERSRIGSANVQ